MCHVSQHSRACFQQHVLGWAPPDTADRADYGPVQNECPRPRAQWLVVIFCHGFGSVLRGAKSDKLLIQFCSRYKS